MSVNEEKLIQYALDMLDDDEQNEMQKTIAASQSLQEELIDIRDSLQHIAHAENPMRPSDSLRNLVLNSTLEKSRFDGFVKRFTKMFNLDKLTAQNLLNKIGCTSDTPWESTPFPGVSIMKFPGGPEVAAATCGLVQVEPGKLFPAHQHRGEEKNFVLQGSARDDKGQIHTAGDLFDLHAGSSHCFRSIGDEPLVYAVVLYQDNKWLWFKTLIDLFRIRK